jgi:uncharacterized repeat protein (TIGR03803 family)
MAQTWKRALLTMAGLSLCTSASAQFAGIYTFNAPYDGCCAANANLMAQGTDGILYSTMPSGVAGAYYGSWFGYGPGGWVVVHPLPKGPFTPDSGLTLGIDGSLYGATMFGGLGGGSYGVIFRISGGMWTTVYYFTGGTNGIHPYAPPIQGPDGNLYGTTHDSAGAGIVYQLLTATGTLGWVRALPSGTTAPLMLANDGNFYGTYPYGGMVINGVQPNNDNGGGVFRVTPAGVLTGVFNLNPLDTTPTINGGHGEGQQPMGPVMQANDGRLYGTASGGGTFNGGVVFRVRMDGSDFAVLHNFQAAEGTSPQGGLVQGSDGWLYGMCSNAGTAPSPQVPAGSLFKVDLTGTNFMQLFQFYRASTSSGVGPGSAPLATPVLHTNGRIYGLTSHGGTGNGSSRNGGYDDGGELFSLNAGLSPFIAVVGVRAAQQYQRIGILGQGFKGTTGITFGGIAASPASVSVQSDTFLTVVVPPGARTGPIRVYTPTASLSTLYDFTIVPCSPQQCASTP